jgi:thioester reductase-like protein
VRSSKSGSAASRIEKLTSRWEAMLHRSLPRPVVICGDLHAPALGLHRDDRDWLAKNCNAILHSAGNVTFHSSGADGEPWRTNVDGTHNLAALAHDLKINEFHHVSTAYVCGDRLGTIREADVDCGQSFGSDYERSKLAAEKLLRSAGFRKLNVLRPGSVTGDSTTGFTTSYHGVYLLAQFTWMAQRRAGGTRHSPWRHPVRLFQSGNESHHLIPVDAVSSAIVNIVSQRDRPGATYHITPQQPCTGFEVEAALSRYFGYYGVRFVGAEEASFSDLNEIESLFYEAISRGQHRYFSDDPAFDCTNTLAAVPGWAEMQITQEYLERAFDFAVRHRFGRLSQKQKHPEPASSNPRSLAI